MQSFLPCALIPVRCIYLFSLQVELLELINEELIVENKIYIRAAGNYRCTRRKICVMVMDHIQLLQCTDVLVLDYLQ